MLKNSLYVIIALLIGLCSLPSCKDDDDSPGTNNEENLDFKSIHITNDIDLNSLPDNISLSDLNVLSLTGQQNINSDGKVKIETFEGNLPQVVMLSNADDDLLLMSRSNFHEGELNELSARTTAIALVTMHPALSGTKSVAYQQLVQMVTDCPSFGELEVAIEESVRDNKSIADPDNISIINALNKVFEQVVSNYEDNLGDGGLPGDDAEEQTYNTTYSRAPELKGVSSIAGINVGPFHVSTSANSLIVENYSLTPLYSGIVAHHGISDVFNIPSGDDRGITFFFDNSWGSSSVSYKFTSEGEYQFLFDKTTAESYLDQARHTICNVLEVLGLPLDKGMIFKLADDVTRFLIARGLDVVGLASNPNTTAWDFVKIVCGGFTEYISQGAFEQFLLKCGAKAIAAQTAQAVLKKIVAVYTIYQACRGAINAVMRVVMRLESPNNVAFGLYYYQGEITAATKASLAKYAGDNQTGLVGHRLNEPVQVKVTTIGDDGTELTASNFHRVKFQTEASNGSVQEKIVATDTEGYAQTYWTLDSENTQPQYLTATVIDIVTGEEISEKVTFIAKPAQTANVTFTLDWNPSDSNCDIDLHIIDPDGHHIYYYNMSCSCGGFLDRDDRHGPGPEHIYFTEAKPGLYKVYVHHFESDTQGTVGFVVTTEYDDHRYVNRSSVAYHEMQYIGTLDVAGNSARSGENGVRMYYDEEASKFAPDFFPQK